MVFTKKGHSTTAAGSVYIHTGMFTFNYTFAAGPPLWKDLPCFIQKALRNFVTNSEVVYDRNFFLKKFGIIVKNPILPYKTQEFKNNIIALKLVDEKESRLRHFQQRRRSILKKYLPLYRSLREEIQSNIKKTEIPSLPVMSDERLIALSSVLGPTFVTRPCYHKYFKRDVPALMSYYSQTILATDRSLQNGLWKITKFDRRDFSMRIIKMWSMGRMTFPIELQEIVNNYAITRGTINKALDKVKDLLHFPTVIKIPHLGIYLNVRSQEWRKKYERIYLVNSVTRAINNTKEQVRENIILRRQIGAHSKLFELIPYTTHLKTRYDANKVDLRALASAIVGIPLPDSYKEPPRPVLNYRIAAEYEDFYESARRLNSLGSTMTAKPYNFYDDDEF